MIIKIIELFVGYGSQSLALENLGIKHEVVAISDIDKYALQAYSQLHNGNCPNLGDITKIDETKLPNCDLLTHSSPCQDFSTAGTQKGGDINSNTRSSLMWESIRIIKHCKPKYVLWENVPNVLSEKHKHNFIKYLEVMTSLGYVNNFDLLNSKDFGVPQNRLRLFCISVKDDSHVI